jgi:hypothetical protein
MVIGGWLLMMDAMRDVKVAHMLLYTGGAVTE